MTIASIVTPLGLYDVVAPSDDPSVRPFAYVRDNSAFGYGTPPRSSAPFVRVCGTNIPCPGQTLNKVCNDEDTVCLNVTYDPIVPTAMRNLFNDGAQDINPTVSGLFDIQWRSYSNWSDGFSSLEWYQRQEFRELANLVLDNKLEAVEGLVVDMVEGGIGFRNHTAPNATQYGTTWSEDLLFVEPESVCVNLNVTIDFRIINYNANAQAGYQDIYITDKGGLSGLSRLPPQFPSVPNGQGDPFLRQRATAAGWYNNFLTLAFYNATGPDPTNITRNDFKPGQKILPPFPKSCNFSDPETQCPGGSFGFQWNSVQSSPDFGGYLNLFSLAKKPLSVPSPYHVDINNFTDISTFQHVAEMVV